MTKRICSKNCCIISMLSSCHNLIAFHYVIFFCFLLDSCCYFCCTLFWIPCHFIHGIICEADSIASIFFFYSEMKNGKFWISCIQWKYTFHSFILYISFVVHKRIAYVYIERDSHLQSKKYKVPIFDWQLHVFVHLTLLLNFSFHCQIEYKTKLRSFSQIKQIWLGRISWIACRHPILICSLNFFTFR